MMKLDEARINPDGSFTENTLNHPAARGDSRNFLTGSVSLILHGKCAWKTRGIAWTDSGAVGGARPTPT